MSTTLDQILLATRARVAQARASADMKELDRLAAQHTPRGFGRALRRRSGSGPAAIAELKRASPSKGMIRPSFHPSALAVELQQGGAAALSVLTEEEFFLGSLDYLAEVSAAVQLPLLRKDFIIDEFQLLEARAYGADAILLIVAALSDAELGALHRRARELELDALCEVHDRDELRRAADTGFEIIGVNNRNLKTFHVDLGVAETLAPHIPANALKVAESGIASATDIVRLRGAGYHAFLIGESLMRNDHPGQALRALLQPGSVTGQ